MTKEKRTTPLLGSHVGMSGKDMLLGSAREAVSYHAETFMFYTGAPQNTRRKEISELRIPEAWDYMNTHHISQIVVHAPYIINLGNSVRKSSCKFLISDKYEQASGKGNRQFPPGYLSP